MKTRFIYNPKSGHNAKSPHLLERARTFIAEHKLDATVVLTERPRHATELARRAIDDGCELIVAIGGDGTMNETAAALIDSPAALGLIPCGSGNGLGRHLGIPGPGHGAFRTLLSGQPRAIDVGLANGHPFFNAMGAGFDAEISHRFNRLSSRGLTAYAHTTLRTWFGFRPQAFVIRHGDETLVTNAFIVAIANSDQYGNDCFIAPGATVDDGALDLTVLKHVDLFNAVPLAVRLFTRAIDGSPSVARLRGTHFMLERLTPGPIHTDGEVHHTAAHVEVSVLPRALRVLVPATAVISTPPTRAAA